MSLLASCCPLLFNITYDNLTSQRGRKWPCYADVHQRRRVYGFSLEKIETRRNERRQGVHKRQ